MAAVLPVLVLTFDTEARSMLPGTSEELRFKLGAAFLFLLLSFCGSLLGFLLPAKGRVSAKVAAAVGILYAALAPLFVFLGALGLLGNFYQGSLVALFSATLLAWISNALAARGAA
jgi:hypothetical protein